MPWCFLKTSNFKRKGRRQAAPYFALCLDAFFVFLYKLNAMKILIDSQPIVETRSGVGRYVFNLLVALAKLKSGNQIIPFFFNFRKKFTEHAAWENLPDLSPCEIRHIPGFMLHRLWRIAPFFPMDFFSGSADIVHYPNFLMKPVRFGKKILTVHDLAFKRFPHTIMPKNLKNLNANFETSLNASDAVIAVSEFTRKEILHFYPDCSKKIHVIWNGIDEFLGVSFSQQDKTRVRQKYGLPSEYLLYVGTIEPRKNLILLLKTLSVLRKENNIKLLIIGQRGWLSAEFYKTLEDLNLKDSVVMPGFVSGEDLPYIYHMAGLFVFPSIYEGFGLPPLEAMACGAPVLAASIPVMHEVLGDCPEYCDPAAQAEEWALKITELLSNRNLLNNMASRGLMHANKFSWHETASRTLQTYNETSF